MQQIYVAFEKEIVDKIRAEAEARGATVSQFVREAVYQLLCGNTHQKNNPDQQKIITQITRFSLESLFLTRLIAAQICNDRAAIKSLQERAEAYVRDKLLIPDTNNVQ